MTKGWKEKKLGEITTKIGSGATPLGGENAYKSEGISLIRSLNVHDAGFKYKDLAFLDDPQANKLSNVIVESGDVLLNITGASIARCCIVPDDILPARVNQHVSIIRLVKDEMLPEFLHYVLISNEYKDSLLKTGEKGGSTRQALTKAQIEEFSIKYPPLPEQQRIVSLLDETFESIAGAKVNAERNLVNARELFETLLNEYFGHARKGWKEMKLDDACIVERGSSPRPIKQYQTTSKDGVNWIKIGDTKNVEKYIYSTREKITKEGAKQSRFVKEGDFILTNSMSFGNPYIMKTEGYIHDGWFVLRLKEFIDTEFFWYLLVSPFVRNQFNQLASGAIVKNISGDLVKKAVLYIPPLAEQRAIVARLDVLAGETKKLAGIYQSKLEGLEELKKSVLARAFEGEI